MMLWGKAKPDPQPEIVYVPVTIPDARSYDEKWNDENYLRAVMALSGDDIFLSETITALQRLREVADTAETPERLAGCNAGISELKRIMTISARAQRQLAIVTANKEYLKGAAKRNDGHEFG
jgi:hypothetical protein